MPMTTPAGTVVIWRSGLLLPSETFIRNQGEALARREPVFVGAYRIASPIAADDDVIVYPRARRGGWGFLWLRLTGRSARLRRVLSGLRPAVVHAHFAGDGWLVSHSAARLGVPLVVTLHGYDVTSQPRMSGPRGVRHRRHLRATFNRASLIIAVSGHVRDRAVELGADPAKVRVHHTGVPIPAAAPDVPKRWDITFVGRFVEKKGIDDLIGAVGAIADPRPRLLLVGDGPLLAAVRDRAAELGLDATFPGPQSPDAVRRLLAESKVFVSPSKTAANGESEGLPTTLLEAASVGVPVVSTFHSGIPEAVVDGETGLLSDPGDRVSLADNIKRLLADDELRIRLGRQARRRAEERFDLRTQTLALEEMYEALPPGRPDRPGGVGQRDGSRA
jgi:colanic acid/amylovoran biosynthesis glycosyltransferase